MMQDSGPRKKATVEIKEEGGKAKPAIDDSKPAEDDPFAKPAGGAKTPAADMPADPADPFGGK